MARKVNQETGEITSKLSPELQKAIDGILKTYGEGAVQQIGNGRVEKIDFFSTGSLGLDLALGVGGIPRGRINEIYGLESSGKTTICLQLARSCQQQGLVVHYVDYEHSLDLSYAKDIGVEVDDLLLTQPDNAEQGLDIAERIIESGGVGLTIFDSVAAMTPSKEIEGDFGDATMGLQARIMSQAMRKLAGLVRRTNVAMLFTNQIRMKLGGYGNPETVSGGMALKFYSSTRTELRKSEPLKTGDVVFGSSIKAKVTKNKVSPPFRTAEFDILFGKGVSKQSELINLGVQFGIVTKRGSWFSYGDLQVGQGFENTRSFLVDNPQICTEIESKIYEQINSGNASIPQVVSGDDF